MDALGALAARGGVDLDVAVQRTLWILETKVAFAAAEQRHEDVAEVLPHLDKGLEEELTRGGIDLSDCLLQRSLRRRKVVALGGEKAEALRFFLVLLDCQRIHRAQRLELLADHGRLAAQRF